MDYTMSKGRDGWEAKTFIPLAERGEGWRIRVSTSKAYSGKGIKTTASTEQAGGGVVTTRIFRDFHGTVLTDTTKRCTEKSVREQHERALADHLQTIIDAEAAWEAEQLAKAAADRAAA